MPAIASGELPILGMPNGTWTNVAEAISIISFSFYTQPMLLPLLSEMPPGRRGITIVCRALQVATLGMEEEYGK